MLNKVASKTVDKEKVINRGRRSKTLGEVKPFENMCKHLQSKFVF